MKQDKALQLWLAIRAFADAAEELGGEGNSGEFHDWREFNRLSKEREQKERELIELFCDATKWAPKVGPSGWSVERFRRQK